MEDDINKNKNLLLAMNAQTQASFIESIEQQGIQIHNRAIDVDTQETKEI